MIPFLIWLAVSFISIVVTVHDKRAAQRWKWRVPEATLLTLGALGGAFAMYVTMRIIRHKTRHLKFMLGLPALMLLHILLLLGFMFLL